MTTQTKKLIQLATTFLMPYIATASGAIAAWLLVRLHILGIIHLTNDQLAKAIASLVIFGITSGLTYIGGHTKLIPLLEKWVESDIIGGTPTKQQLSHPVVVNVHIHNPDNDTPDPVVSASITEPPAPITAAPTAPNAGGIA